MAKTVLILLVGEQPAPNLLPTRHLSPDTVALVYTEHTKPVAERLKGLLPNCQCFLCGIADPYNISQ